MPLTSIVIRTRNEARCLGQVLQAIGRQTWTAHEVIIVDSGSTDETLPIARRYGTRVIEIPPETFTYGAALNRGIHEAQGEYIVALSGHAIPAADTWLASLLAPLLENGVGAVYGRQLPSAGCNPFVAEGMAVFYGTRRQVQTADHKFSNANAAWRKRVWELEPFDERIPYAEDQCWAAAVLRRGVSIVYEPDAAVHHSHDRSLRQIYRHRRAEVAALKWMNHSTEQCTFRHMVSLWWGSTRFGWRMTWQARSHWRWQLYCPLYYLAYVYGYYRGLCDPLSTISLHGSPSVSVESGTGTCRPTANALFTSCD